MWRLEAFVEYGIIEEMEDINLWKILARNFIVALVFHKEII